jgi:hypothetical protein
LSSASTTLLQPKVVLTPLGSSSHMSGVPPATTQSSAMPATSASSVGAVHSLTMDMSSPPLSASSPKERSKVERNCLPVKEREYDPDKHCGVWNGENSRPCTRSLTCPLHPLSMKRAVSGRSKHFDKLLADHLAAKDVSAVKLVKAVSAVPGLLSQVKICVKQNVCQSLNQTSCVKSGRFIGYSLCSVCVHHTVSLHKTVCVCSV